MIGKGERDGDSIRAARWPSSVTLASFMRPAKTSARLDGLLAVGALLALELGPHRVRRRGPHADGRQHDGGADDRDDLGSQVDGLQHDSRAQW